jgi:hypothetical protein
MDRCTFRHPELGTRCVKPASHSDGHGGLRDHQFEPLLDAIQAGELRSRRDRTAAAIMAALMSSIDMNRCDLDGKDLADHTKAASILAVAAADNLLARLDKGKD